MMKRAVPEFAEAVPVQRKLDMHIDKTIGNKDKSAAAAFYHIREMSDGDFPETIIYLGDHMVFDPEDPESPEMKFVVDMRRTI